MKALRITGYVLAAVVLLAAAVGVGLWINPLDSDTTTTAAPPPDEPTDEADEAGYLDNIRLFAGQDAPEDTLLEKGYEVCESLDGDTVENVLNGMLPDDHDPNASDSFATNAANEWIMKTAVEHLCPRHTEAFDQYKDS